MKRKNDEVMIGDDGEIIDFSEKFRKRMMFSILLVSFIAMILGLFMGMIFQFGLDKYKPDLAIKTLVLGCLSNYDTSNPVSTDLLNSYYRGSAIAESMISCLKSIRIEGSDMGDHSTLDDQHLGLLMVGCLGNTVRNDKIDKDENKDKFFNCLSDNYVRFRIVGVKNELTPDPPAPYIPVY